MPNRLRCEKCGRYKSGDNHICGKRIYTKEDRLKLSEIQKKTYAEGRRELSCSVFKKGHSVPQEWKDKIKEKNAIAYILGTRKPSRVVKGVQTNTGRTHFKKGERTGIDNPNWKGNNVGYYALHSWVKRNFGISNKCEKCGTIESKKFEWHNKSGEYRREKSDWVRLCAKCHLEIDGRLRKLIENRETSLSVKEDKIIKIEKSECDEEFMDLQTELGNYFAGNIIVHNSQPSRRSQSAGVYLPSTVKENIEMAIWLDTSGSIDETQLKYFCGLLQDVVDSFANISMTVICCDSKIQGIFEIGHGKRDVLEEVKPKGGGGTNCQPVIKFIIENKPNTKLLICITDGELFHKPKLDGLDAKIIWLIPENGGTEEMVKGTGEILRFGW